MKKYDLIVLGTGGAGYQVAVKCAGAGMKVAAVDRGPFGGTCSVRGCIPKKVLAGTAEVADINRRLHGIGIVRQEPSISWAELIKFERTFTNTVPDATKRGLKDARIDVYEGSPRFASKTELEVGGQKLSFEKAHIAVGLEPAKIPINGFEHMIDSDDFLELDVLPKRILFIGGGYISFEFAHVAARFGAETTILHADEQPLPMFDPDIVDTLREASEEAGIKIELNVMAWKIEKNGGKFKVMSKDGRIFEADLVVHGAGRVPAVSEMNLEAADVEYDKHRGVKIDNHMRSTSNPNVYAAGDAADSGMQLTPVAGLQGAVAADNLLGNERALEDLGSTASVIFSTPPAAKVGLLEDEAREKGIDFDAAVNDLSGWFDSRRLGLKFAKSKVLTEKNSDKIIGAHIIGNHAEDLINMFALAIESGLTAKQFKAPVYAFPTASDDAKSML